MHLPDISLFAQHVVFFIIPVSDNNKYLARKQLNANQIKPGKHGVPLLTKI